MNRKKTIRAVRWSIKIALLLLFIIPLTFLANAPEAKVFSFATGGVKNQLASFPLSESVCSIWTVRFSTINPFAWIICPLGGLQALVTGEVSSFRLWQTVFAILLFIIPIAVVGNVFCGWICPLGTMIDAFDEYIRKFKPKIEAHREERSRLNRQLLSNGKGGSTVCPACPVGRILVNKYGIVGNGVLLGTVVGAAVFKFNIFCTICPIGISTRGIFHLKATTYITKVVNAFFLELLIIPIAAILMSLREKRFWCNKICPVGALLVLGGSLSPFLKPQVNPEKCIMKGCPKDCPDSKLDYCGICRQIDNRKCERVCPSNINLLDSTSRAKCTKCMECYCACDKGAIEIKMVSMPDAFVPVANYIKRKRKKPAEAQQQNKPNIPHYK
jgi:ferredoxin-type protein NapH